MTQHEQYVSSIVTPALRPGEQVLAVGVMYYDLPVVARVLLVFVTMWIRVLMIKHYFAVATNQRLILIRTKQTWFTPKMMNLGVETIEYADIASIQPGFEPAAKKLIIKTKNGASRPLFMSGSCKVLPSHGQLHASFQSWVQAAIASGGAIPGAGGAAGGPSAVGGPMPGMGGAGMPMPTYQAGPPPLTLAQKLAPFDTFFFAVVLGLFSLVSGCMSVSYLKTAGRHYDSIERYEEQIDEAKKDRAAASAANDPKAFAEAKRALKRREEWRDDAQMDAVKKAAYGGVAGFLAFVMLAGAGGLGFVWSKKHKGAMEKQAKEREEQAKTAATGSAFTAAAGMNAQAPPAGGPVSGQAFSGAGPMSGGQAPMSGQAFSGAGPMSGGQAPMSGQAFAAPASMQQPAPSDAQGQAFAQPVSSASYGQPAPAASQPAFAAGARVQVTWPNGQRYGATVVQVEADKVLCTFDGGQQQWVDASSVSA